MDNTRHLKDERKTTASHILVAEHHIYIYRSKEEN
jgi:hypothetical protein